MDLPDLGVGPFKRQSPRSVTIDEPLATDVYDRFQESGPVISIRPYKGEGTMTTAESFLTSLHVPRTKWRGVTRNVTDASAFEIVFDSDRELLQFRYVGGNEDQRELLKTELEGHYQDAEVAELPPAFLNVAEGKYVAAARLRLRDDDYLVPIKNYQDNHEWFADRDPYDSITQRMTGTATAPDTDVLVQITMKPAISDATWNRRNWFHGIEKTVKDVSTISTSFNFGELASETGRMFGSAGQDLGKSMGHEDRHHRRHRSSGERSEADRWTKETNAGGEGGPSEASIRRNRGKKGYWWNIRIIAVGDDPEEAKKRVERTANAYETFYASQFQQGFVPEFVSKRKVSTLLQRAASRSYHDLGQAFGVHVMNGVSRIPVVSAQQADYTLSKSDQGVPPRTTRFEEFDETGYVLEIFQRPHENATSLESGPMRSRPRVSKTRVTSSTIARSESSVIYRRSRPTTTKTCSAVPSHRRRSRIRGSTVRIPFGSATTRTTARCRSRPRSGIVTCSSPGFRAPGSRRRTSASLRITSTAGLVSRSSIPGERTPTSC